MPDLDRSIYDQLHRHARGLQVPSGDVNGVVARGRLRRNRQRGALGVVAVVGAAALTGSLVAGSGGGHPTVVQAGKPGPAAPANAQLHWSAQPEANDLGYTTSLSAGATDYALSTAPGVAAPDGEPAAPTLWSSTDGVSWQAVAGPAGISLDDVATDGATLYTVGTGTATAATSDFLAGGLKVASSSDGGGAWHQAELPLDFSAPAGALNLSDIAVKIAAGSGGVVAVVTPSATLDLSKVFPAGVSAQNWTATPTGIDLLGTELANACGPGETTTPNVPTTPGAAGVTGNSGRGATATVVPNSPAAAAELAQKAAAAQAAEGQAATGQQTPAQQALALKLRAQKAGATNPTGQITAGQLACYNASGDFVRNLSPEQAFPVLQHFSWAQLQLGPEAVDAVLAQPILFFSSDGTHFGQVSLPAGGGSPQSLTAGSDGFVLATNNLLDGDQTVFRSANGQQWTAYPLPASDTGVMGAGVVHGQLLAVGQDASGGAQILVWQGSAWTDATALPATSGEAKQDVTGVAFGPIGVAVTVENSTPSTSDNLVLYSPDGTTWSTTDLNTLSGGPVAQVANVAVDAAQVVVTVERPATASAGIDIGTKTAEVAVVGTIPGD